MNSIIVEKWEAWNLSSDSITKYPFDKENLILLYVTHKDTNTQYLLTSSQTVKGKK